MSEKSATRPVPASTNTKRRRKADAVDADDPHKVEKLAKHGRDNFDTDEASD